MTANKGTAPTVQAQYSSRRGGSTLDPVQHDEVEIDFLEPDSPISDYPDLGFHPMTTKGFFILVLETTFNRRIANYNQPDPKPVKRRADQLDENENAEPEQEPKNAAAKLELSSDEYEGLCIIKSQKDPGAPLKLLPPSFLYPSCIDHTGVIWVDKTQFIGKADAHLSDPKIRGCFVALPPNTGKTTFLLAYVSWVDCGLAEATFDRLFGLNAPHNSRIQFLRAEQAMQAETLAEVFPDPEATTSPLPPLSSSRQCLCLIFDLGDIPVGKHDFAEDVIRAIDQYLLETTKNFIVKYRTMLGTIAVSAKASRDPNLMISSILDRASGLWTTRKIFIAVDHWDSPILKSLENMDAASTADIATHISEFLADLNSDAVAKLLVLGNFPLLDSTSLGWKNISSHPDMSGAFGVTSQELKMLFSALSRNRRLTLSDSPDDDSELTEKLGYFTPPPLLSDDAHVPSSFYNFALVLNHVATVLNLNSNHKWLEPFPGQRWIAYRCQHLLQYSGLRQGRRISIPPIGRVTLAMVVGCIKNEVDLRSALVFLGWIKVVDPGMGPDPQWTTEMSSRSARDQLFAFCQTVPADESYRDMQVRALADRDPVPMANALTSFVRGKPLMDLYVMTEASLQTFLDTWILSHSRFDPNKKEEPKYLHNYFSQVGLCTDPTKIKGKKTQGQPRAVNQSKSTKGKEKAQAPKKCSKCGCDCRAAKAPAQGKESGKPTRNVPAPKFSAGPDLKIAGLGPFGYADSVFMNLELHRGRVIVVELKYLCIQNLIRAEYDDDDEYQVAAADREGFRERCLVKIEEMEGLSIEQLGKHGYCYWSQEENRLVRLTIQDVFDGAPVQLRSYMGAIVNGEAGNTPLTKGVTTAEKRIEVKKVTKPADADEVIGYIYCGIGRRIITFGPVDPEIQNTQYQFKARPLWQSNYEARSADYAAH
ncbi:hypothetical protein DFH06DRAFT_1290522 [Mycena polygramma]|nr:hypothetical protein DFH06DRAFT_1290522 [Mycena polygramma]